MAHWHRLHQLCAHVTLAPTASVKVSPTATLHYEVYGDPRASPVLFFAHGAGGNGAVWWRNVPYLVERGYCVITHDARFFGTSSKGDDALAGFAGGPTFAADAIKILDACGVERAAFICQSMGGTTGVHAAVLYPERVSALVMCNTHSGITLPPDLLTLSKQHSQRVDHLDAQLADAASSRALGASLGGKALSLEFQRRAPELAFWYGANGAMNQGMDASNSRQIQTARLAASQLGEIRCPVLLLTSDHDPFFAKEVLQGLAPHFSAAGGAGTGAEVKHFSGHGHSVYFEDPHGFNYSVAEFLGRSLPPLPPPAAPAMARPDWPSVQDGGL